MTVIITNNVEYDRNNFCLWKVNVLMTVSMNRSTWGPHIKAK